jgi:competence protein ComEC
VFCLAILGGLGLARKFSLEPQLWWLVLAPALILLKRKNITSLLLIVILGLGIGLWRGGIYMQKLNDLKQFTGQKVTIQGVALTDSIYGKKSQMEFTVGSVHLVEPQNKSLTGKFKISGFGTPMVYRGEKIQATGKLYPIRGSNQAIISYAQLQGLQIDNNPINKLTRNFGSGMQNALPEPLASFALGLLIGQRNTLPESLTTQLTMVGLVHIVAVSGYNLTILVRGTQRLRLGSKYQRFVLSLALISAFILITGFSASIVRAAIVSILSLWAWYYGRNIRPVLIITFTAALTGLISPFYVWSDLGWYLSFLAFFGVLVIAPLIAARLFKKEPKALGMILIETLSAEIMALPLIMMTFGQLSLIALVANLLIVPLVPLAMLLTAIAAAAGMLIPQIAGWFAWPAQILLTYMLDLVRVLSSIPSVLLHASISVALMVGFYSLVLLVVLGMHRHVKSKKKRDQIRL